MKVGLKGPDVARTREWKKWIPKIVANMKGIYETEGIEDVWLDEVSLA